MFIKVLVICLTLFVSTNAFAFETTQKGKILFTQGHSSPNCRVVKHKENDTGDVSLFRIKDVPGDDDVAANVLAALIADRDVTISYDPNVTTGCGPEPKVIFVTIY